MPQAVWPRTPGRDFAGTVVSGPSEWIGREVYGSGGDIGITRDGSHARYLVLPESALRAKPQGISMDEAGAVGVPFVTAYEGFRRSGMPQAGQTVLVLGANGKVGQAAVQLASQAGARVIAVQRHAGPFEGFASGPVDVIDARHHADVGAQVRELTDGRGAHIVYNTVGSAYFEAANKAMAKGATQIFIATHERAVPFDIFAFYRGMHTFVGIDSLAMDCVASTAQLDAMREGFERGTLKPFPVARHFTLDEAMDAYRLVLSGSTDRVVLRP
jgi:NADPH:quinone reductase-like Zn-dependent oxidoreductase